MKIFILVKRNILTIIFMLFLFFLVVYSKNNLTATKDGLTLWATCVVPSLFPFFIATELLNYTNITKIFGKLLSKVMRPIFNIPGEGAYAFIMGIISGYPVGAKIVSDFYENGICTKNEAERMLSFTNNSGPLFIIGTVGILLFGNSNIGILLFVTHILSSITVGIILGISSRFYKISEKKHISGINNVSSESNVNTLSNLGNILANSISKSITTVLQIGGFVVLFSVILSILNRLNVIEFLSSFFALFSIPKELSNGLISGIIELTNGASLVANLNTKNISINIIVCAFLLGFGGFSVLLQVLGIISRVGLNIKTYMVGKFLQGIISALYTSLLLNYFPIFSLDIPTPSGNVTKNYISIFLLLLSLLLTAIIFFNQRKNIKA